MLKSKQEFYLIKILICLIPLFFCCVVYLTGNVNFGGIFDDNRTGDHIWWITDYSKFSKDFPKWKIEYKLDKILKKIATHEIEKNKL